MKDAIKDKITQAVPIAPMTTEAVGMTVEPLKVFASIFVLAAIAGLASTIAGKKELTSRAVVGAITLSGTIGLIIGLVWWNKFGDTDIYFLVGVSILAGLGGNTSLGLFLIYVRKKFNIDKLMKELDDD